ncbi:uncharacterized protein PFLUO_LOCUS5531 [Penicillium psychrofluorescens]|uniref:uncharacterized protein n=1 Tax=Penicillium psychrofluorescens TaxID=3158075 RepID=UPI003CCE290B
MGDHVLFFYGTLMAPQVLHRVVHGHPDPEPWQKALLSFKPAVLHGYKRHRVRSADYPGIVPASGEPSTQKVLGTLVSGLTDGDLHRLDLFEGSEYERRAVAVRPLHDSLDSELTQSPGHQPKDSHLRDVLDAAGAEIADEEDEVAAVTYVWIAGMDRLEAAEWDFETFKRDKMAWWVNADESEW